MQLYYGEDSGDKNVDDIRILNEQYHTEEIL